MSGIFGASTKWFSTSMSGAGTVPTPDTNLLTLCWYKQNVAGGINGRVLLQTYSTSSENRLQLLGLTGPKLRATGKWGAAVQNADQAGNLTENVWRLAGAYLPKDDGTTKNVKCWDAGATDTTGLTTPNTATLDLTEFTIGQGSNFNTFSFFDGRLAEVAVFLVGSETEADTIMAAAATQTADTITLPAGSTLIAYYPLLSSSTATVGPALSDHGSVTFDGADHPSLSGGGGGSSFSAAWARFANTVIK